MSNCKNAVSSLRMVIQPSCTKPSIWCVLCMPELYNNDRMDRIYMLCFVGKYECKNENVKHLAYADSKRDWICNVILLIWQISYCIKSLLNFKSINWIYTHLIEVSRLANWKYKGKSIFRQLRYRVHDKHSTFGIQSRRIRGQSSFCIAS